MYAVRTSTHHEPTPTALPRRIVHVPRRFVSHEWGGTETVVLELAKQQQAAGYDPVILTSMALANTPCDTIGGISVQRHRHSYPFFGLSAGDVQALDKKGGNILSMRLFAALLGQRDVRLFHAHSLKRLGGMVRSAARIRLKPYVVTLHGGVFDVPEAERKSLVEPIKGKFEWGRPFGALFGSRRVLEDADMVICVGESERAKAAKSLGHDRLCAMPNGVDADKFTTGDGPAFRARFGIPAEAFMVLNVARIDRQKNQMLLVRAFHQMLASVPHAHLVLIGPETQPEYAAEIRGYLRDYQLSKFITIIPGLPPTDDALVDAFHAADLFVMPSRHEPFGIAVLEAWCAGLPVIASNVGGLGGLIAHGHNGLHINPAHEDAVDHLAAEMEYLAVIPDTRAQLGAEGRKEAHARYTWTAVNEQMETIYQRAERFAAQRYGKAVA